MASNWYVNYGNGTTTGYFAVAVWASGTPGAGAYRRPTAPTAGNERVYRASAGTTAGTEPTWPLGSGSTVVDNTVTWTECSGAQADQGTSGTWAAPAARHNNASLATAAAVGDTYYVANTHAETSTSATYAFQTKGTAASPCRTICVAQSTSMPPVSADISTGASITTTGAFGITFGVTFGSNLYSYVQGLTFAAGTGATNVGLAINAGAWQFKNCKLQKLGTTSSSNAMTFVGQTGAPCQCTFDNTTVKFGNTSDGMAVRDGAELLWINTTSAVDTAGSVPTSLFNSSTGGLRANVFFDGVDLSGLGSGKIIAFGNNTTRIDAVNCKFNASITSPGAANTPFGARLRILVSDSAANGYRQEIYDYAGALVAETTTTRQGGASDGVQLISHKITATANAKTLTPFEGFQMAIWNTSVSGAKTVTLHIVSSAAIKDTDAWLEVAYLGDVNFPRSLTVVQGIAGTDLNPLYAGATLATSTETWNAPPATPSYQKLEATFTPLMAGFVRVTLKLALASKLIYACPKLTLV